MEVRSQCFTSARRLLAGEDSLDSLAPPAASCCSLSPTSLRSASSIIVTSRSVCVLFSFSSKLCPLTYVITELKAASGRGGGELGPIRLTGICAGNGVDVRERFVGAAAWLPPPAVHMPLTLSLIHI